VAGLALTLPSFAHLPAFREAVTAGDWDLDADATALLARDPGAFLDSLQDCTGTIALPDGTRVPRVPQETLWLAAGDAFVGEFRLRTRLSWSTRLNGGHIGYTIRPSWRGRGAATRGLALAIARARDRHGLPRVLLTCAPGNAASRRVIAKNGGVYQDTVDAPHGLGPTMRFWADVGGRAR
jgi:predicted acetyltransferase